MFFITTDRTVSIKEEFLRVFRVTNSSQKSKISVFSENRALQAVFFDCERVEVDKYTVFISGRAFPDKTESLKSALKKTIQSENAGHLLHGNFNLVIFNRGDDSFSITSDRYGTIPCFFSQKQGVMKISPAFHFCLLGSKECKFDEQSLLDYLCLGRVLPEQSLWEEIRVSSKGKVTVFPEKNHLSVKDVGDAVLTEDKRPPFKSLKECAENFKNSLTEVIHDEITVEGIKSMLLTGGSDTRILLSCMDKQFRNEITFITYDSPSWSSTNNDQLIARLLAEKFHLNHKVKPVKIVTQVNSFDESPWGCMATTIFPSFEYSISGMFGTELFGGFLFNEGERWPFIYSQQKSNDFKENLLNSLLTSNDYKRLDSPLKRLNQRVLSQKLINKEGAFMVQTLYRSQFTSYYSYSNSSSFIIPYINHWRKALPYMDTRILDVFFRTSREYLLRYNLYWYVLKHLSDKQFIRIPFNSHILQWNEDVKELELSTSSEDFGVYSKCDYKKYFKENFTPHLFEGTFLSRFSNDEAPKIPEPLLHRICDLTGFLLELKRL